jgi:uncharacterized protein YraI
VAVDGQVVSYVNGAAAVGRGEPAARAGAQARWTTLTTAKRGQRIRPGGCAEDLEYTLLAFAGLAARMRLPAALD